MTKRYDLKDVGDDSDALHGGKCANATGMRAVVLMEHLRPLHFHKCCDPDFQMGPWHSIRWEPSLDFLDSLLDVVCEVGGFCQEDFTISPALKYSNNYLVATPTVGIFANDNIFFDGGVKREIDLALAAFCSCVIDGQEIAEQKQLFPSEISQPSMEIVMSLASKFLEAAHGKRIGEARLLKTSNGELLVSGAFRPPKDAPLPSPQRWSVVGEIDGIRGVARTIFLNVIGGKTIAIFFDESTFKERLRQMV